MGLGIPVIANSGIGDTDQIIEETNSGNLVDLKSLNPFQKTIAEIDMLCELDRQSIRDAGRSIFDLKIGISRYNDLYLKMGS